MKEIQNLTMNEYDEMAKRCVAHLCNAIMQRGIELQEGKTFRCHAVPDQNYLKQVADSYGYDKKDKQFYARLFYMLERNMINVDSFCQEFQVYHIIQRQIKRGIKVDLDACKKLHLELSEDVASNKRMLDILVYGTHSIVNNVDVNARLHGDVNTISCDTYKMAYSKPAINTIPKKYRSIFVADNNYTLIKADAKQLHAVILAQYLIEMFNSYELAHDLASDLHSANMKRFNVSTRDEAKREFYARLYSRPQTLRLNHLSELIGKLKEALTKRDYIKALDGRVVYVDDPSKALVYLLSSADAILMKRVLIELDMLLLEKGFKNTVQKPEMPDYEFVMNVHDEIVIECRDVYASEISQHVKEAFKRASNFFKMKINIECDLFKSTSL